MANRRFHRLQALQKEIKKLHVSIETDASGDVTNTWFGTGVKSVTHTGNVYSVELDDRYYQLMHVGAMSGVSSDFHIVSSDVMDTRVIEIEASALQADTTLLVEVTVKNTSVVR